MGKDRGGVFQGGVGRYGIPRADFLPGTRSGLVVESTTRGLRFTAVSGGGGWYRR